MSTELEHLGPAFITPAEAVRVADALAASRSAATRYAYTGAFRRWTQWAEARQENSLPADPTLVAVYLTHLAEDKGQSPSSIDLMVAAIRATHEDAGMEDPTAVVGIKRTQRGIRNRLGSAPGKQAHPLTVTELTRMLASLDRESREGKRDAAILLLGFGAALRRSEIAGLQVGDLAFKPTGVIVRLRKSKGDQEGAGVVVGVANGQHLETDPVRAVSLWVSTSGLSGHEPLFQKINRGPDGMLSGRSLTGSGVNLIVKRIADLAGLEALGITGHSLRAGHATVAAENGVPSDRLARTTRHKNLATLARYVRPAEVLRDTSSGSLGL